MLTQPTMSRQVRRKNQRFLDECLDKEKKAQAKAVNSVTKLINRIFEDESIEELAFKLGVIERVRELTPVALIGVMMLGCDSPSIASLETMCSYLREFFDIDIKPTSLQAKINTPNTVKFIETIMDRIMKIEVDKILNKILKKTDTFYSFNSILLEDSTTIPLYENLSRLFPGCGGSGSKAAVKIDFIIDLKSKEIKQMKHVSGKIPDASLSGGIIDFIGENDLVLRDLGYFKLAYFKKIIKKKAFFISRLSKSVNVYLKKNDKTPIDLIEYMKKNTLIDLTVYIGSVERMQVRLIGIAVPPDVVESRRQQHKKNRGKKEPSEALNEWNKFTFMITNAPRVRISLKSILKLYALRWQIEIFFKACKSNLTIDNITGENKYRILGFLFLKLCAVFVASMLYALAQITSTREISIIKFTNWVKKNGLYKITFTYDGVDLILKKFERDVDLLYKKKTKDKSWWKESKECQPQDGILKAKVA